jgi:uncharacterized membrane protein SpoIIM required for sporulation
MKHNILFTFFVLAGLIPVYTFSGWIYIFNKYRNLTHIDKQHNYNKEILLGVTTNNIYITLTVILLGLCSIVYFSFQLRRKEEENKISILKYTIYLALIIIFAFFTLLTIWSIL